MFTNGRTERFHSTQTKFGGAFYDLKKKKKKKKGRGESLLSRVLSVFPQDSCWRGLGNRLISRFHIQPNRSSLKSQHPHHHYTTTKKKKKKKNVGNTFLKSPISKSKQNLQISNYQCCRKSINSYP